VEELAPLIAWARSEAGFQGVLLVGSRARGAERPDSDVDLVIVAEDRDRYLEDQGWLEVMSGSGPAAKREHWGALTSLRLKLASGLELDLGLVEPGWASTDPVDPGTARVISDGARILLDPQGLLGRLLASCRQS